MALTGKQWANIAVTGITWLLIPLGDRSRVRDECRGQVAVCLFSLNAITQRTL
jgi:hypothetical protein